MKGSLTKFQFVCFIFKFIFIKTFCRGVKQEGVKSKYDLPSDLPMDAKQHAWTTAKGAGYLVFVSSHYFKMRQLSVSQFVYFSFILREREEEKNQIFPTKENADGAKTKLTDCQAHWWTCIICSVLIFGSICLVVFLSMKLQNNFLGRFAI